MGYPSGQCCEVARVVEVVDVVVVFFVVVVVVVDVWLPNSED